MNAHLANEVNYDVRREPGRPGSLIHLIVSDACLAAAGVPLAALGGGPHPPAPGFRVEAQTRAHATGECGPWGSVFAAYMPRDALGEVLAPAVPGRPGLLPREPSPGGLFVSLPLACDARGVYDPYTTAALRVCWGPAASCARVLLFSYDELVPPTTRYAADGPRLTRLCRHFCRYVGRLGAAAPAAATEAAAHLAAGLGGDVAPEGERAPGPGELAGGDDAPISPEEQLAAPGGDAADREDVSITREDEEILALVQRAVRDVARRHPVRAANPRRAGSSAVASGLRQGAMAHQATAGAAGRGSRDDAEAVFAGLEPPGGGRFGPACVAELPRPGGEILGDVLTLAPGSERPRSLVEWLDRGWEALADGDRPCWLWSRRPVSLVPRHHYATKGRFVVVSYENSVAWGGRSAPAPRLSRELAEALTEACAGEDVLRPQRLSPAAQAELLRRFPALEAPLRHARPVLAPFDVAAEVAFVGRVQTACLRALGGAIRAALQGAPRITQRVRYEFDPDQSAWIGEVARRLPVLLENVMRAIEEAPADDFFRTAYAAAALSFLGERVLRGRRFVPPGDDLPARFPDADGHYVFDYYSTSGTTLRTTDRPIAVVFDGDVNREQSKCRFLDAPPPNARRRVCERYLPGESYAYLCLGFNRRLHALVVFPGGFAFAANVAAYLTLGDPAARAIVQRFCREVPAGRGAAR
ncbi:DNA packaging tegument protein UL17 [Macacine alphaherpesvirus 3]|uniref:DNA packaging tegument protein UL17 n=1 Tax=Macacine alphaherpesvirus 3 TaxID=2845555 RepID=A0A1X9WGD0_9ALPH|nr:DNA packaging tegument protein UL17 [Macacine alphaherpesvirus 1]ARS01803.1 DNA packaging tegument protein UL17 [Macacine alphaherpesvirus 3]